MLFRSVSQSRYWMDRTDIADYTPQVLFDINQDGWVETQIDVDYFKETDEPF